MEHYAFTLAYTNFELKIFDSLKKMESELNIYSNTDTTDEQTHTHIHIHTVCKPLSITKDSNPVKSMHILDSTYVRFTADITICILIEESTRFISHF